MIAKIVHQRKVILSKTWNKFTTDEILGRSYKYRCGLLGWNPKIFTLFANINNLHIYVISKIFGTAWMRDEPNRALLWRKGLVISSLPLLWRKSLALCLISWLVDLICKFKTLEEILIKFRPVLPNLLILANRQLSYF